MTKKFSATPSGIAAVSAAAFATGAFAQSTVVVVNNEPASKLVVEPPLPGPLAEGKKARP